MSRTEEIAKKVSNYFQELDPWSLSDDESYDAILNMMLTPKGMLDLIEQIIDSAKEETK